MAVTNGSTSVHEATYELEPGAARIVYDLREANPDGIEQFRIEATLGERTESVTVRTNRCHGEVHVSITEGGDLFATYSIC